jgi:hypothetical protein
VSDGGSSSSSGAAADKRWTDAAMAVEDAGVQLSPARSWQQHLHDGMTPAAALQVQGQQRMRQVMVQQQQQQHATLDTAAASCAGTLQEDVVQAPPVQHCCELAAAGPPKAGCFDSGRVLGVPSDALSAAPAAECAAEDGCCNQGCLATRVKAASVQALMRDGVYVRRLLASLPGVDPSSPHVQHAVLELQRSGDSSC